MTITPITDGPLRTIRGRRRRQEETHVTVTSQQHITHDGRPLRVNYVDLTYREDSQLGVQALITGSPVTKSGRLSVKVEKVALVSREWPEWLRDLARDPDYTPDWFTTPAWLDEDES